MRLFSWYGLAALLTAAGCGYVAGVAHRPGADDTCCPAPIPSREEEATAPPPGLALNALRIEPVDVIDLTCAPHVVLPFELFQQTHEPPLAGSTHRDSGVRQASFEFPAGPELPPFMPYLDD